MSNPLKVPNEGGRFGGITGTPYCWKAVAVAWCPPPCGRGREPHWGVEVVGGAGRDTLGGVVALSGVIEV
jgi:hypothetical protein